MTEKSTESTTRQLKIEQLLPATAVGIENTKENLPQTMSEHRKIFPWFARRPTAATRLAILASLLPADTTNNDLLKLMGIGPREYFEGNIEDYVISREASLDDRDGSIEDHFGYDYLHKQTPESDDLESFHERISNIWDDELPTVLDPTAGGGTIPLEAARYGLPTISNELNPVAWLINKVLLEYTSEIGPLESELQYWLDEIHKTASDNLSEYFPEWNGIKPDHYFRAYSITCTSCGRRFPLTNRWWFNKQKGMAIKPNYSDDGFEFDCVNVEKADDDDFNPAEGTVDEANAECPYCSVVTEREELSEKFSAGEFQYEVCGVRYEKEIDGTRYHAPRDEDIEAVKKAKQTVESDLNLSTFLAHDRYIGRADRAEPYGITQWRDMFSPRQLLSHAKLLEAYEEISSKVASQYNEEKSEAIQVLLSFVATKLVNRNTRLQPIKITRGTASDLLGNNNYSFNWHFAENNLLVGTFSYLSEADNVLGSYETVCNWLSKADSRDITVLQGDGASLEIPDEEVEAVVMDPPYGDNIMYAEMADVLYVLLREYLSDTFAKQFASPETDKQSEAIENPEIQTPSEGESRMDAARQHYESKMSDIFSESHRVLRPGGVITVHFTDKDTYAWDSLTMSLIEAGFTITATHTLTSEVPQRIGMQEKASADSTLLLTCRKPTDIPEHRTPTLWDDIKYRTRDAARNKANELLDSELNVTKTDVIIGAFGPTLQVFTEEHPVVDKHDNPVRPRQALEEARTAVTEVLIERELGESLDEVDNVTKWYLLSWLVYEREAIPYDEARQLGLGVGIDIDEIKRDTKLWSKSKDTLMLKGYQYRVRDIDALEAGEKRRKRAYPVDPRHESFECDIDTVHAVLNIIASKGSDFAWNWINNRNLQDSPSFKRTIVSLLELLPEDHSDYDYLVNLASGETGSLLNIRASQNVNKSQSSETERRTIYDYE